MTRANVSLLCLCDECGSSFRLQSFHSGFSALDYFYCESGLHTLVVPAQIAHAPERFDPDALAALPPCRECGKRFRYLNALRCPGCHSPYIDFAGHPDIRAGEYYGNFFYGGELQRVAKHET